MDCGTFGPPLPKIGPFSIKNIKLPALFTVLAFGRTGSILNMLVLSYFFIGI